jgi:hypothetical protein
MAQYGASAQFRKVTFFQSKFCKALTTELADGIPLTKEEYVRVEDGPLMFKDKITVYQCSVCSFIRLEPKAAAWQGEHSGHCGLRVRRAYHRTMAHLSDWHVFDPSDMKTYPSVDAPVQVRFEGGKLEEGGSRMFFPKVKLLPGSSINAWRYIKGVSQR